MAHEKMVGLPMLVCSPVDVGRLERELETINQMVLQGRLQHPDAEVKMPKTSVLMDQAIALNQVDLLDEADRQIFGKFLAAIKANSPVLHISFSADPSPLFMEKLTAWIRQEIHPLALITVGVQPNIGAGCIVRSVNKYFDFSLRKDFEKKRDLLLQKLTPETKQSIPEPAGVAT